MLTLGALSFAAPWLLAALIGLPVLWWLLRVTPPAPRLLRFPAIRLLFGLNEDEQTPARTPWWLIVLRMAVATLVILALAHPLWNAGNRFAAAGPGGAGDRRRLRRRARLERPHPRHRGPARARRTCR